MGSCYWRRANCRLRFCRWPIRSFGHCIDDFCRHSLAFKFIPSPEAKVYKLQYEKMNGLMNGWGYYIEFNTDELDRPQGWDVVIDATGNAAAIQDGLDRVAKAGTFLQFGVADYATRVTIDPYRIYNQEITITGSMAVLHSFERAAELFAAGVLDPEVFISDRLPLSEYPRALERFGAGVGRKIVVVPSG